MKRLYLPLAVLGLIVPYFFLGTFLYQNGADLNWIISGLFGSPIATFFVFFVADLVITTLAFWIFLVCECRRLGLKNWGFYIAATLLFGPSFAFPLFLYFRELRRTYLREKHSHHDA